jgi:hypothetical protein
VLLDAYAEHPERFVHKVPTPPALPTVAWINEPVKEVANSLNWFKNCLIRLDTRRRAVLQKYGA